MPTGTVTVTDPAGRTVYINGNYTPDVPKTIECTFLVEYGENIFETCTGPGKVDYRVAVTTDDTNRDCSVALEWVP
jgi:hypothetical protein